MSAASVPSIAWCIAFHGGVGIGLRGIACADLRAVAQIGTSEAIAIELREVRELSDLTIAVTALDAAWFAAPARLAIDISSGGQHWAYSFDVGPGRYAGHLDGVVEGRLTGWTIPLFETTSVVARLVVDGSAGGEGPCDGFRPEFADMGPRAGLCGFSLPLPPGALDGRRHQLEVHVGQEIFRHGAWRAPGGTATTRKLRDLSRTLRRSAAAAMPFLRSATSRLGGRRRAAPQRQLLLPEPRSDELAARIAALGPSGPTIAVVVPVYETPELLLRACVRSVLEQAYPAWRLILVDDGSRAGHIPALLDDVGRADPRVTVIRRAANGGISAAMNDGLDAVREDVVAFLDHDDHLTPDALLEIAETFLGQPELDAIYTDQVKSDAEGVIREHFFKPDWSPIYLLGVMYVGHLLAVRSGIARDLRFQSRFDGVQDFEFMLRLTERTQRVGHVAKALYGWRAVPGSLALATGAKRGIDEKQARAVEEHLGRIGRNWQVVSHPTLPHRLVIRAGPATPRPPISIVIPSRDAPEIVGRCLSTMREITRYPEWEVLVVDNGSTDPQALAAIARHADRSLPFERPFNFSEACNLGAEQSRGEVLVFLNNDTEIVQADWLSDMVAYLEDPDIAIVGPLLLYPDGTVQHAGVVLGARGTADHVMRNFKPEWDGYAGSLAAAREVSAVTGACLMIRRGEFEAVGGFSTDYNKHYQDVDLCLRVRERGKSIVCCPQVRLIHHESVTRKVAGYDMGDRAILVDRWHDWIAAGDRFYSRNLDEQTLRYEPKAGVFAER